MAQALRSFEPAIVRDGATRSILPAGAKRFLHDRMMEISGLVLAIGVAAIAVALFSYVPTDLVVQQYNRNTFREPVGHGRRGYCVFVDPSVWYGRLCAAHRFRHAGPSIDCQAPGIASALARVGQDPQRSNKPDQS